jgi:XTP/dITP diphosphohydrolase
MKELYFASQNENKLKEIQAMMPDDFFLKGLRDLDYNEPLQEDYDTLEQNAYQKAHTIFEKFNVSVFADDTGLEVTALNGEPGVKSARYAGESRSNEANIELLLENLQGVTNRSARFRTVIALILDGKEYQFEGIVEGDIMHEKRGSDGFGYDPIFIPQGYTRTFAEMSIVEKNKISHRKRALQAMIDFLESIKTA